MSAIYKGTISNNSISNIKNPQNGDYYIIAETGDLVFFNNGKFMTSSNSIIDSGVWDDSRGDEEDYSQDYFN